MGAKYAAQTRCRSITNKKQSANQLSADHGGCPHHERIIGYGEVLMSICHLHSAKSTTLDVVHISRSGFIHL